MQRVLTIWETMPWCPENAQENAVLKYGIPLQTPRMVNQTNACKKYDGVESVFAV